MNKNTCLLTKSMPGLSLVALLVILLASLNSIAEEAYTIPKTAHELGLMAGFPPPKDKVVNSDNFMKAPFNRWSFQHVREIFPTREISKGRSHASILETKIKDLSQFEVDVVGDKRLSVERWLQESYTDAFLVMHKGQVVYERYFNGQQPDTRHQMFSVSKSFAGTMLLSLVEQGLVDTRKLVREYLPELKDSAYGDATVQQVLDMTNAIKFSEDYTDNTADIWQYGFAFGIGNAPKNYQGPKDIYGYLATLKKKGTHGEAFHYVTPDADVVGWIVKRVAGNNLSQFMQDNFWAKMGMDEDAYYWLDQRANEMAGGGLNMTLRDAGRFGQMIVKGGEYNGQKILSPAVTKQILTQGDPEPFNKYYQDPWYEHIAYAYHDQWWVFNNAHKAVSAIGVHGQFIYMDPVAEVVIVKQSSHPDAESESNEVDGPQIMHAIAAHLMMMPR
jgi:CubicO group peptidase (beta-lactamase class C family)